MTVTRSKSSKDSNKSYLRRWVDDGTPTVAWVQSFRNPVLDVIMKFVTRGGDEVIFLLGLPFIFWNIDHGLARRILSLWWTIFYFGNGIKDVVCLPRPPSPPIARLESHYENEYGFPSTHSASTSGIGSFMAFYLITVGVATSGGPVDATKAILFAFVYWVCIVTSRLYLGVHTPVDIYGGATLGLTLSSIWASGLAESLDVFVTQSTVPVLYIGLACGLSLALRLYPNRSPSNTAFEDVTSVTGVIYGVCIGSNLYVNWSPFTAGYAVPSAYATSILGRATLTSIASSIHVPAWLVIVVGRTLLGFVCIVASKEILKAVLTVILRPPPLPRQSKSHSALHVLIRLVSYGSVGWASVCGCPWLFEVLGLTTA